MPKPLAICIEDLDAPATPSQYTRCVAVPGRQPGLRLDGAGRILWRRDESVACELWVSADERLILYRLDDAPSVVLHRAGRSLDVPCSKPVVLIDQDQVDVGGRHLRVHIHGEAAAVAAPSPLLPEPKPKSRVRGRLAQGAATAAVVGAIAAVAGGCIEIRETPPVPMPPTATPTVEVRDFPPEVVVPTDTPTPTIEVRDFPPTATASPIPESSKIVNVIQGEWTVAQAYDVAGEQVWITGTLTIEGTNYTFIPASEITGTAAPGALDFLFEKPTGVIILTYNIDSQAAIENIAPEYTVAYCAFGTEPTRFEIKVGDSGSLLFADPSRPDEAELWRITK
jgi:hypothetical protein